MDEECIIALFKLGKTPNCYVHYLDTILKFKTYDDTSILVHFWKN